MRMRTTRLAKESARSTNACGRGVTSIRAVTTRWPPYERGSKRSTQTLTATGAP
jgi:hypothetical protein